MIKEAHDVYREEDDSWASVLADPRTPEHIRNMIRNTPGLLPDEDEGGEFSLDPEKVARAQEESPAARERSQDFVRGETHAQARRRLGINENLTNHGNNNMKITKEILKQLIKEELTEYRYDDAVASGEAGAIGNVAAAVREAIFSTEAQVAVQNNRTAGYAAMVIRNMARVMERAEKLSPEQLEVLEAKLDSLVSEATNIRKSAEVTTEL